MATKRVCSIPDCGKRIVARGFCPNHYHRLRKYGDPLSGGTANGEPRKFLQNVVLNYKGDDCLTWPFARGEDGVCRIWDGSRTRIVSRLVCETVHGMPPTPEHEAAHSCGKGHESCVNPNHLRWATCAENHADKLIHGTHNRGERCGTSRLKEDQVLEIRSLKGVKSQTAIAEQFGVSQRTISFIHRGERWSWLNG